MKPHGGIEQRVWMHWKSFKHAGEPQYLEDSGVWMGKMTTPNWVWLRLARTHKMKVRQIKDIISARRGYIRGVDSE